MNKKEQNQLTVIKKPRYIKFGEHKCMVPKDIVPFDMDGIKGVVYGDPRLKGKLSIEMSAIKNAMDKSELILVLKKPKKKGGMIGFPVPYTNVLDSRRVRLANYLNMERNAINKGADFTELSERGLVTTAQLLKELGLSHYDGDDLQDEFLVSDKDSIICSDLKRIIHLKFEEAWNNGK